MGTGGNTLNVTGFVTNAGGFRLFGPDDQSTVGGLSNSGLVDVEKGSSLTINSEA